MTIVHTEASAGWGGQEIRIWQEGRWLRRQGHRVLLFGPGSSELLRRGREDGFETEEIAFEKRRQWLDCFRLARVFRRLKPDVVGTHSSVDSWAGLLAARMARVPVALRYRHVSAPVHAHFMNRFLYRRCCDHVLTTAECIRQELVRNLGVPENKVTTVPTGIEPPVFTRSREEARREVARKLGLPETERFIGCVAVLRSWKGQDLLMQAFDSISDRFPKHHLLIVGDGIRRKTLETFRTGLRTAARIHLFGHANDPWPFFRAFDVAVLPSYKDEGIPQSLLQAMFAECPVVGSNAGGIPEIVKHEQTGLLAPPRDVPALAAALVRALQFPAESEARAREALEFVSKRHALETMGSTVLRIIGSVLAKRRGG